jgi:hypothetical protein
MSALVVQIPSALVVVSAAVGWTAVGISVGGIGVAVDGTMMEVAAGAPHPTKNNAINVTPIICCGKCW